MKKLLKRIATASLGIAVAYITGCSTVSPGSKSSITKAPFGRTAASHPVEIYTLRNDQGAEARIMTYGGIVQSLSVPDKNGHFADVVLGYDHLQGYIDKNPYFGALIGRYGNRIAGGKFTLEGRTYTLATNNGPNSLHGGRVGFDKVVWTVEAARVGRHGPELALTYFSKSGEEGFPGNLKVKARYVLTDHNELKLEFTAKTDQATVINLTHHSYFNLAGQGSGDVLGHVVTIYADQTTPVGKDQITTGEFADVTGTPFDFRQPTKIGARINDPDPTLQNARGYDQNWVINKPLGKFGLLARVVEPGCGRWMEVWSDEPGLQFYTGNFLNGTIKGKGGALISNAPASVWSRSIIPIHPTSPIFRPWCSSRARRFGALSSTNLACHNCAVGLKNRQYFPS